jgi:transposase InsO family protein
MACTRFRRHPVKVFDGAGGRSWRRRRFTRSNGLAEAFVKTFKRDYIRINPLPDARTALSRIDRHPHSQLGYRSPREYIASLQQAACPV